MKLTTLILTSAIAAFAANVSAEEAKTPPSFSKADLNGDKRVDADEYAKTGAKKKFAELDTNGDGKLSKGEYAVLLEEDCE